MLLTQLPALAVAQPHWLYAHNYTVANVQGLMVYRSPIVKYSDPIYKPVLDTLVNYGLRLILKEEILDDDMIFGRGLIEVYRLGDSIDHPILPLAEKFMEVLFRR